MTVTVQHLERMRRELYKFGAILRDLSVELVDGGTAVVKGHVGIRASGSPLSNSQAYDLTGASDQDKMVCLLMAKEWDLAVPRPPRKGDIVNVDGIKYAFERVIQASPGGVKMVYKVELRG